MSGLLFVVTAASGTGKTSLVKALLERLNDLKVSVSHTTRPMRVGEQHGVHYHFTSTDEFLNKVAEGGFIEHAEVFGNYYGTSHEAVSAQLSAGHDVLLEIDWQGAEQVRRLFPESIQIFIVPPTRAALRERLSNRGQDSAEVIERRLAGSVDEMRQYVNFDYLIVNDVFEDALHELEAIIIANRLRLSQQTRRQAALLEQLFNA
jgi:guanylate kinase